MAQLLIIHYFSQFLVILEFIGAKEATPNVPNYKIHTFRQNRSFPSKIGYTGHIICRILYVNCPKSLCRLIILSIFEIFEIPHFPFLESNEKNGTFQIFPTLKIGCFEPKARDQFWNRIRTENENLEFWKSQFLEHHSNDLNLWIV